MALAFAGQVFRSSLHTTPQRALRLSLAIAQHAQRIPPTLLYALAQNNNHLLSEATGLFTAAMVLPHHPHAPRWRALGWRWFNHGVLEQISGNGTYMQHSANYHRLILHLGLWINALCRQHGTQLPELTLERLAAASRWLFAMVDPISGQTPNLGANDGANILPLSEQAFRDYRPVIQAAWASFLELFAFRRREMGRDALMAFT